MDTMLSTVIFLDPSENVDELAYELGLTTEMYSVRIGRSQAGIWQSKLLITGDKGFYAELYRARDSLMRYPYQLESLPIILNIDEIKDLEEQMQAIRGWIVDNLY